MSSNDEESNNDKVYGNHEERFNNYINFLVNQIHNFENFRRIYLEINFSLMIAIPTIFTILLHYFNLFGQVSLICGILFYLFLTLINILNYSIHRDTRKDFHIQQTFWFYKDNIEEKKKVKNKQEKRLSALKKQLKHDSQDENKKDLIDDDIEQIFNLYQYQFNYKRKAIITKWITLIGIIGFIICLIISILSLLF